MATNIADESSFALAIKITPVDCTPCDRRSA
jgi:hypothetical protein